MRTRLLATCTLLLFTSPAYCDYIRPSDTVRVAIHAAQSDSEARLLNCINLESIKNSKTNPLTKSEVIKLFKSIDIKKIKWKDDNAKKLVIMTAPLKLSFVIEAQEHKNTRPSTTYRIIEILEESSNQ